MNEIQKLKDLSSELAAIADSRDRCIDRDTQTIKQAAQSILKLSRHICGQGFVGCRGGEKCSSDHK